MACYKEVCVGMQKKLEPENHRKVFCHLVHSAVCVRSICDNFKGRTLTFWINTN
jgi:hypothetical protein